MAHDNDETLLFFAEHDGYGNVHIMLEMLAGGERGGETVGAVSFIAAPRTAKNLIARLLLAVAQAEIHMPNLKMSLQELPQSSEAHNGR